jgi:hypothetical protein
VQTQQFLIINTRRKHSYSASDLNHEDTREASKAMNFANTISFLLSVTILPSAIAFQTPAFSARNQIATSLRVSAAPAPGTGFGKIQKEQDAEKERTLDDMRPDEIKKLLLDLLPRMTGTREEFRLVENYVNAIEAKYVQPQTLGFLNMAIAGEWQFLFTTNQLGNPSPSLRLSELVQTVSVNDLEGKVVNSAKWDMLDQGSTFDVGGTFTAALDYNINEGARMTLNDDLKLQINLRKGSKMPSDKEKMVALIKRAIPDEMFDSSNLALDTTYVDTDLRIIRYTGNRHEAVRNIFIRKGQINIDPGF